MANVIKHKRGSGSDPAANNLVLGELAIRTDVGKLFTKMDSGAIAEIAGGGSDIAINTLSSSSATGGGSATFNGSAYRFTLSQPPSVSAYQLLVSINGVIQKPVAGTGQPSEGFSVDGTDIILGDAPATGADFFILTFKSLGVSEPADNSVTSAKIVDGAIVNADINASAAIAGTKISPDFGSQTVTTTGTVNTGLINASSASDQILNLNSSDNGAVYLAFKRSGGRKAYFGYGGTGNTISLANEINDGDIVIAGSDGGSNINMLSFDTSENGRATFIGNVNVGDGLDVTGAITGTGDMTIDTNTLHVDSSNNRVGIGTTSPSRTLHVSGDMLGNAFMLGGNTSPSSSIQAQIYRPADNQLAFATNGANERMRIDSSGNVGISTTSPLRPLSIGTYGSGNAEIAFGSSTSGVASLLFGDGATGTDVYRGYIQYNHSQDALLIATQASERMRINSSGRVGIDTTDPRSTLHIGSGTGGGNIPTHELMFGTNNSDITFLSANDSASVDGTIGSWNTVYNHQNSKIVFNKNAGNTGQLLFFTQGGSGITERMRIDHSGKVGIGTTSADQSLHIYHATDNGLLHLESGDSQARIKLKDNAGETHLGAVGNDTVFWQTSSLNESMRIDSSGDIGLGTSTPNLTGYSSPVTSIGKSGNPYAVLELQGTQTSDGAMAVITGYNTSSSSRLGSINWNRDRGNNSGAISFETANNGTLTERFRITRYGGLATSQSNQAIIGRDWTSGSLAAGATVNYNGSGGANTDSKLNFNSIGGNGGGHITCLSVSSFDQNPSGALIVAGVHGQGFNSYETIESNFDSGISVTFNSTVTIQNTSSETLYYAVNVIHMGTGNADYFGR